MYTGIINRRATLAPFPTSGPHHKNLTFGWRINRRWQFASSPSISSRPADDNGQTQILAQLHNRTLPIAKRLHQSLSTLRGLGGSNEGTTSTHPLQVSRERLHFGTDLEPGAARIGIISLEARLQCGASRWNCENIFTQLCTPMNELPLIYPPYHPLTKGTYVHMYISTHSWKHSTSHSFPPWMLIRNFAVINYVAG